MARRNPPTGRPNGRPPNLPPRTSSILKNLISDENENIETPEAPSGLNQDGLEAWDNIWGSELDIPYDENFLTVKELCFLIDETAQMRRALALGEMAGGVNRTYRQGKNGSIVIHPFVNQIKDNRAMIMSWLTGLGFSSTARKADNSDVSAMDDFKASTNEFRDALRASIKDVE